VLYALLGVAGVGRVLNGGLTRVAFGAASAVILVGLGMRTLWLGWRARAGLEDATDVVVPRRAFLTAVAATALNPLTIALWTVSFPAAAPHAAAASAASVAAVLGGVGLGTLSWYAGLATVVAVSRRRLRAGVLRAVDVGSGCALLGFGGLLGYRAAHDV
jgi:threonine/homoserine/homoserine lactone efflux protein